MTRHSDGRTTRVRAREPVLEDDRVMGLARGWAAVLVLGDRRSARVTRMHAPVLGPLSRTARRASRSRGQDGQERHQQTARRTDGPPREDMSPQQLAMLRWTVSLGAVTAEALPGASRSGWPRRARGCSPPSAPGLLMPPRLLARAPALYTATSGRGFALRPAGAGAVVV